MQRLMHLKSWIKISVVAEIRKLSPAGADRHWSSEFGSVLLVVSSNVCVLAPSHQQTPSSEFCFSFRWIIKLILLKDLFWLFLFHVLGKLSFSGGSTNPQNETKTWILHFSLSFPSIINQCRSWYLNKNEWTFTVTVWEGSQHIVGCYKTEMYVLV